MRFTRQQQTTVANCSQSWTRHLWDKLILKSYDVPCATMHSVHNSIINLPRPVHVSTFKLNITNTHHFWIVCEVVQATWILEVSTSTISLLCDPLDDNAAEHQFCLKKMYRQPNGHKVAFLPFKLGKPWSIPRDFFSMVMDNWANHLS